MAEQGLGKFIPPIVADPNINKSNEQLRLLIDQILYKLEALEQRIKNLESS